MVNGISIRMGIATGFCTVGNFGSDLRLDYTVLGSPVNLAARLESMAEPDCILIDENTKNLIEEDVECEAYDSSFQKDFLEKYRFQGKRLYFDETSYSKKETFAYWRKSRDKRP